MYGKDKCISPSPFIPLPQGERIFIILAYRHLTGGTGASGASGTSGACFIFFLTVPYGQASKLFKVIDLRINFDA